MAWHTTVQNQNQIFYGSGIIEIAEVSGSPSWVNLGAVRGFSINEELNVVDLNADNAQIKKYVSDQGITFSFELMEWDPGNWQLMRGEFDTVESVAGTPVVGGVEVIADGDWNYDTFVGLANQMYDGSAPTINSVTGSVDGVLVDGTDYDLVKVNDVWGIVVYDSLTVTTEAQTISVDSDYTPAASTNTYSGGKQTFHQFMARFTNLDENGDMWRMTVYLASLDQGFAKEFTADDADDIAGVTVAMTGDPDVDREVGKQSYLIEATGARA